MENKEFTEPSKPSIDTDPALEPILGEPEEIKEPGGPFAEVAVDAEGWHWCIWAGNGRIIARNPVPYTSQISCVSALRSAIVACRRNLKIVKASKE